MTNLFKLIVNEQIKIYMRKSTWVMYIALAVLIIGMGLLTKFDPNSEVAKEHPKDTWREELKAENEKHEEEMEEMEQQSNDELFHFSISPQEYEQNLYYLENDIRPEKYGMWHFVHETTMFLSLISLFTIIIAAGIISNEYHWGTIKLLLIRPISRSKILLSKYLSIIIFSINTILFLFLSSLVTGMILFGYETRLNPYEFISTSASALKGINVGDAVFVPLIGQVFAEYGFQMIILIMMATFALLVSTIFQNNALAIGLSIFLMLVGNSIVVFLSNYSWAKYILFANTNLKQYVYNDSIFEIEGMSLHFSIMILVIYYLIFIVISWLVFTKRDISDQ